MSGRQECNQVIEYAEILRALPDAISVLDRQNRVVFWNSMAEKISGYRGDELVGQACPENLLQNIGQCAPEACHGGCSAQVCLNDGERREIVTYLRHVQGHLVPVLVKLSPVTREDEVVATVVQFSDMTPRAVPEPRLNNAPETGEWIDAITLLPSMLASTAQLREYFERWKLTGERFSVLLVSIVDAHSLEQQHGSKTLERLFAAVGKTLSGAVRQNDFVGCWMEKQFIVLLPHCAQLQARDAARRLMSLLQQTAVCHDGEYVSGHAQAAVTAVRASDDPAKLLERVYQELRRKQQVAQPTSARTPIPFQQQRPM